jgi:uncharacterized protein YeeX (DUF496 family)
MAQDPPADRTFTDISRYHEQQILPVFAAIDQKLNHFYVFYKGVARILLDQMEAEYATRHGGLVQRIHEINEEFERQITRLRSLGGSDNEATRELEDTEERYRDFVEAFHVAGGVSDYIQQMKGDLLSLEGEAAEGEEGTHFQDMVDLSTAVRDFRGIIKDLKADYEVRKIKNTDGAAPSPITGAAGAAQAGANFGKDGEVARSIDSLTRNATDAYELIGQNGKTFEAIMSFCHERAVQAA